MRRATGMLCAVAMIACAVSCGGGGQSGERAAEPSAMAGGPAADSAAAKLHETCRKLCERVGESCASDPLSEYDADSCREACLDETDGVLMDVDRCLGKSESCAEAVDCRAEFGD